MKLFHKKDFKNILKIIFLIQTKFLNKKCPEIMRNQTKLCILNNRTKLGNLADKLKKRKKCSNCQQDVNERKKKKKEICN